MTETQHNNNDIRAILQWPIDDFNSFQERTGIEFCAWFYYRDKQLQEHLLRSKSFWDEFKENWEARDKQWMEDLMNDDDMWAKAMAPGVDSEVLQSYLDNHSIQHMRECPSPACMEAIMKEISVFIHQPI